MKKHVFVFLFSLSALVLMSLQWASVNTPETVEAEIATCVEELPAQSSFDVCNLCFDTDFTFSPIKDLRACGFDFDLTVRQTCRIPNVRLLRILGVSWDFGDGNSATGRPQISYIYGGACPQGITVCATVKFIIVNQNGQKQACKARVCKQIL